MTTWLIVVIVILGIQICDTLVTFLYCRISKNYYESVKLQEIEKNTVINKNPTTYLQKIVDWIYSFYSGWVRYKLRLLGKVPCHCYRKFKLKYVYQMNIEKKAVIYGGFEIRFPWCIKIGEGSIIGDESKLDGRNGIIIGKNVTFSTGVWIWTDQHDLNDSFFANNDKGGMVRIDDYAWLSSRTTILPNVHIGKGAVIAASAVVTKDCEEYFVYGGIPAKKIAVRNSDLKYRFDGSHLPFY